MARHRVIGRAFVAASCVVVLSVAGAIGPQRAAATPPGPATTAGIAWTSCDPPEAGLDCGTLAVPLDWNRPDGAQIELAVLRHAASRPQERIGTMFLNPGGPGQSGVQVVRGGADGFDVWGGGRFDVVGWDPRGTNASAPVECFRTPEEQATFWAGVTIPSTAQEAEAYRQRTVELARRCGEVSGNLLPHISTADTARDLDALRRAVGDDTLTYVGLSYGSMIGQTYAGMFPDRVRAMLLDGLIDPVRSTASAEERTANDVAYADEVFGRFLELCAAAGPSRCALAGHDEPVDQRAARVLAETRQAPIPAPAADPPGELSHGDLLLSTFTPLRLPETWPQFAADLDAAASGDASALETAARQMRTPEGFAASTTSSAVSCLDGPAQRPVADWPEVIDDLTASSTLWGPVLGWWLWAPCASDWPATSPDRYTGPWDPTTPNPILLINARYDPATGHGNAVAVEQRLGNAVLLTLDGYGHPAYQDPSACIDQARTRYLVDLATPPPGTVCEPDGAPFP